MDLRTSRIGATLGFHSIIIGTALMVSYAGMWLGIQFLSDAGGLALLFHLLSFQRLPFARQFAQRLIRLHRCGRCGHEQQLTEAWKCGCGYSSATRHAFSPCPQCGKGFAWIGCPSCGTSTLV